MQVEFYGKKYSFNTKAEALKAGSKIYKDYLALKEKLETKYKKETDELTREYEKKYREVGHMYDALDNSKEEKSYYAKIVAEKLNEKDEKEKRMK